MGRWTAERWAASSGMAFAVLLVVGSLAAGQPPHYNAPSAEITAFLGDHHGALMTQAILGGVGVVLWVWFLSSYAGMYRDGGQGRLATVMYGAGAVGIALLAVGDTILFSPRNKISHVKSIEGWPKGGRQSASAGESIGITLAEQIFVERGQIGSHEADAPIEADVFKAKLFWLGRQNLEIGRRVKLKLTSTEAECHIQSIDKIIDASTLEEKKQDFIARNDVAEITIRTKSPIAFDNYDRIAAVTGQPMRWVRPRGSL